jgi:beta-fructofuranosidase
VLELPDSWTWDFWLADTGEAYHLFFLRASRALLDPARRHLRASVGHAVSVDLVSWQLLPDALVASDADSWDDLATWTGSVLQAPDGRWRMFYTAVNRADRGLVQRIGCAVSDDLITWRRDPDGPIVEADSQWYERLDPASWIDEAWRDPWVYPDPQGDGWHMLITARANEGPADDRGVIGHARSPDLTTWTVQPPLSTPGAGFGQLEVPQVEVINGRPVLIFSCLRDQLASRRQQAEGGVWAAPAASMVGPFDIASSQRLTDESLYAGRVVRDRDGNLVLLAFRHSDANGDFRGGLADPIPLRIGPDGSLPTLELPEKGAASAVGVR